MMKKKLFFVLTLFVVILSSEASAACNHPVNSAINSRYIFSDTTYHITTWHCTQCNMTASNKSKHFNGDDGRCLCGYCYHPSANARNSYSQYIDDTYHLTTWLCSLCNNTVANKYRHTNNNGKCECGYCSHPDDKVKNLYAQCVDDTYHIATWTCSDCKNVVSDKLKHYKECNGRCECGYCYHPNDEKVNIYKQYIDNNYHMTTWTCSICNKSLSSKDRHNLNSYDSCECGYAAHYCVEAYCSYNYNYNYNNNYPNYSNYYTPYTTYPNYYNPYTNYNSYTANTTYNPYYNYPSYYSPNTQVPYFAEIQAGRYYVIGEGGCVFKKIYNTQTSKFEDHYCGYRGDFANMVGKILLQNGNGLYDTNGIYVRGINEI